MVARLPRIALLAAGIALLLALPLNAADAPSQRQTPEVDLSTPVEIDVQDAAGQIDRLVNENYRKHQIKPNPRTSDEVFVRRAYLDIVGRIPTYSETTAFLTSRDGNKRDALIDQLISGEGYVSHNFNWYADLLRVKSRLGRISGQPYVDWIKDQVRTNTPYDEIVRHMLTAEGYIWNNGAAGYYLRDDGMPLDNMANTTQVFLGTQLGCAQCHDHPYDIWTQAEFYELAAFTYGVQTRMRNRGMMNTQRDIRRMSESEDVSPEVQQLARNIVRPLAYKVNESDRVLRLPHDYQYSDYKPKSVVKPMIIFGEDVPIDKRTSKRDAFANWMTASNNPRFTTVIANRMWKKVMGMGLIEPADDIKEDTVASNPELMAYLTQLMKDVDYDLRTFQRILFRTDVYQRAVARRDPAASQPYHFPGPMLERMSAEQLWDSILTLAVPDLDERPFAGQRRGRYGGNSKMLKELETATPEQIMERAKAMVADRARANERRTETRKLQQQIAKARRAKDDAKVRDLMQQFQELRQQAKREQGDDDMALMSSDLRRNKDTSAPDSKWQGFSPTLVRASEIEQPAQPGHFLRQFGQSDRDTIENAQTNPSVPQILTLLNGPIYAELAKPHSVLYRNLMTTESVEERVDIVFLSLLSRKPTGHEKKLALAQIEKDGSKGMGNVVWALLNTRHFAFVE